MVEGFRCVSLRKWGPVGRFFEMVCRAVVLVVYGRVYSGGVLPEFFPICGEVLKSFVCLFWSLCCIIVRSIVCMV